MRLEVEKLSREVIVSLPALGIGPTQSARRLKLAEPTPTFPRVEPGPCGDSREALARLKPKQRRNLLRRFGIEL